MGHIIMMNRSVYELIFVVLFSTRAERAGKGKEERIMEVLETNRKNKES